MEEAERSLRRALRERWFAGGIVIDVVGDDEPEQPAGYRNHGLRKAIELVDGGG